MTSSSSSSTDKIVDNNNSVIKSARFTFYEVSYLLKKN